MTSEKSPTSVRRRRIAGERSRPTERPAPPPSSKPKPASKGGPPRGPSDARSTAGWRPGRPTLAWFVPLCVLTFAAAGVAIGLGVLEARDDGDLQDREDAVAPAGQAAEELLSFRYDTLEAELESERELMTDSYAEEFLNVFPDQAQDLTSERQATVESTVLAAAPLECGDECSSESVDVLLYLNTEAAVQAEAPEVNPNRAVVTMNLEGDQWLVDGIELF
jgi:Mce-associated membrane protein